MSYPPKNFPNYVALMSSILETKPSNIEEANADQVWQDAMTEEYNSIIKNDVKEIVTRPIEKSAFDYSWLHKIKHAADISIHQVGTIPRRFC